MKLKAKILKALGRLALRLGSGRTTYLGMESVVADGNELVATNSNCLLAYRTGEKPIDGGKPCKEGLTRDFLKPLGAHADVDLKKALTRVEDNFPQRWEEYFPDGKHQFRITIDADVAYELLRSMRDIDERPKGERFVELQVPFDTLGCTALGVTGPNMRAILMPVLIPEREQGARKKHNLAVLKAVAKRVKS